MTLNAAQLHAIAVQSAAWKLLVVGWRHEVFNTMLWRFYSGGFNGAFSEADQQRASSEMPVLRLFSAIRDTAGHARGRIASPVGCHRLHRRLLSNVAAVLESRAILEIRCTRVCLETARSTFCTTLQEQLDAAERCVSLG